MIFIKAFIEISDLNIKERAQLCFGKFSKEMISYNGKKIIHYKIPQKIKYTKLKTELKKNDVSEIAFKSDQNVNFVNSLSNEFYMINCKKIMLKLIDKILLKIVKSLGIKDGKLSLGLMIKEDDVEILQSLKSIRNRIKCIYLYCSNHDLVEKACDEFYKETGVGVIIRDIVKENQINLLIYIDGIQTVFPPDLKFIINLNEKEKQFNTKTIEDVKLNVPTYLNGLHIKDLEINELFDSDFTIKGFIIKNA